MRLQSTPVGRRDLWTALLDAGLQQRLEAALLAIRGAAPDAWRERGGEFLVGDLDVHAFGGVPARRAVETIEGGHDAGRAFEHLLTARPDHESVLSELDGSLVDVVEADVDLLRVGGECPQSCRRILVPVIRWSSCFGCSEARSSGVPAPGSVLPRSALLTI